jgi:lipoprotein-anchoring transpeptidase ErfK/SrfK
MYNGFVMKGFWNTLIRLPILAALTLAAFGLPHSALAQAECGEEVIVARGDSLIKIARRCGTTVDYLLEMNPDISNPSRIRVGQRVALVEPELVAPELVILPARGAAGSTIEVRAAGIPPKAAIQFYIAQDSGDQEPDYRFLDMVRAGPDGSATILALIPDEGEETDAWTLAVGLRNRADDSQLITQVFRVSPDADESAVTHVVQRGDRLVRIASRYGTNVTSIMKKNPEIENPHRIFVGQRIAIPGPDEQFPDEPLMPRAANPSLDLDSIVGVQVAEDERWIDVNITAQTVYAYEGSEMIRAFLVSTGRARTPTMPGQFRIYVKFTKTDMRGPGYHLKDVPFTMYYDGSYGLHGTYWHNNFGTPMSNGCINLRTEDAQWLFNFASVGTFVNVH